MVVGGGVEFAGWKNNPHGRVFPSFGRSKKGTGEVREVRGEYFERMVKGLPRTSGVPILYIYTR